MVENNEILIMLGEVREGIKSLHDKADTIKEQVVKTNGRVTSLEHWRTGLMSKVSVVTGLISVIVGSVWHFITK